MKGRSHDDATELTDVKVNRASCNWNPRFSPPADNVHITNKIFCTVLSPKNSIEAQKQDKTENTRGTGEDSKK